MNHDLKIDEPYLKAKLAGDKLFEIRFNDRGYQKGDTVTYTGYDPTFDMVVTHKFEITYISHYQQKEGWCVFGEKYLGVCDE